MHAVPHALRARGAFAARAGVSFSLVAASIGGFYFFTYEILSLEEPPRYAFWLLAGAVFLACCGASASVWLARRNAHLSIFVAALLGLVAGLFWAFAATLPIGLFPGRFEIPIIVVWPLAGMFAFAYADSAQARIAKEDRGPLGLGFLFMVLAVGWTFAVKGGLDRLDSRVDFARMIPNRRFIDPSGLGIAAKPRGSCWDPAPLPQPVTADSNTVLTAVGSFSTPPKRSARFTQHVSHSVDLWAAGNTIMGVMTSRFGSRPNRILRARLEAIEFDRTRGSLRFSAYYADGYYDHFDGTIEGDALHGILTTADAACIRRILTTEQLDLEREASAKPIKFPFGQAAPRRVADIAMVYPRAYVRPLLPEAIPDTTGLVPASHWVGPLTAGARFEAKFSSPAAAERVLRDSSVIARFDGKTWTPAMLLVQSDTLDPGKITWLIAGPLDAVRAYLVWLERPEYRGPPLRDLHYDFVSVRCCGSVARVPRDTP